MSIRIAATPELSTDPADPGLNWVLAAAARLPCQLT
jgi:hypothetical protein